MKYNIGILGSEESITGFTAIGLDAFPLHNEEQARKELRKIVHNGKHAILFITDDWAERLSDDIDAYKELPLPAITIIPSHHGSSGEGMRGIRKMVEQAVGSDILQ